MKAYLKPALIALAAVAIANRVPAVKNIINPL